MVCAECTFSIIGNFSIKDRTPQIISLPRLRLSQGLSRAGDIQGNNRKLHLTAFSLRTCNTSVWGEAAPYLWAAGEMTLRVSEWPPINKGYSGQPWSRPHRMRMVHAHAQFVKFVKFVEKKPQADAASGSTTPLNGTRRFVWVRLQFLCGACAGRVLASG